MTELCEHLAPLEAELRRLGVVLLSSGKAWSENCRCWLYFDCLLDLNSLRQRFSLPEHVVDHSHLGTHEGREAGFVCTRCHDAIMGINPKDLRSHPVIR